jgi:hypothetical protein
MKLKTFLGIICMLFLGMGSSISQSMVNKVTAIYSLVEGVGTEAGVVRGDPSDIIKVGSLYYVWYNKIIKNTNTGLAVWYATSPDGYMWTEKGNAIAKGEEGSWDDDGVFTSGILVANNTYYLFYSGINNPYRDPDLERSKTRIGIATSDSPNGPWTKLSSNPILIPSNDTTQFDSHRVDDSSVLVRDGKYWLYYKGRQWGKKPTETKMGLAIADKPEGPYIKYENNPVVGGGHEVLVWPQGEGVATIIGKEGPSNINRSIMYAKDGLNFTKTHNFTNKDVPHAPGAYRPDAFTDDGNGQMIEWGLQRRTENGVLFLGRFDLKLGE